MNRTTATDERRTSTPALRVVVSAFAALAGFAGAEHGVGELLQDRVTPSSLAIASWPDTPAFDVLGGEPAMTLIPNLAASGLATIIVSTLIGIVALRFARGTRGAVALLALSLLLLVVGGGFGPPLIGAIVGLAAMRAQRRERPSPGPALRALASRWRAFMIAGSAGFVGWSPGCRSSVTSRTFRAPRW